MIEWWKKKAQHRYEKLKEEAGDYVKILPNKKFLKMQKKLEVLRTS